MKKLFLLLTFAFIACSNTPIPGWLIWEYKYQNVIGEPIDSADVDFVVYYSDDSTAVFNQLGVVQDTSYYLLQHKNLYVGKTWFFYVKARLISAQVYSGESEKVWELFNVIEPGKAYNLKVLKVK